MSTPRVEMVVTSLPPAGMETVVVELSLRLAEIGYSVGFTCVHGLGALAARLEPAGIRVRHVPLEGLRGNLLAREMRRHLMRDTPEIVHSHSGAWHQAALPARSAGVRGVVHTVHGLSEERERFRDRLLMRLAARRTHAIVAVSRPLAEYVTVRTGRRAGISTIPNGVDTSRFRPGGTESDLRHRLSLSPGTKLVGNVARLSPVKDHATLLRAFARVAPGRPEWHLVVAGEGPLRQALAALTHELGLSGRVHMTGLIMDVAPLYRDLDVFILSSLAEGTSISLLEAMASGLPVVATAVGGSADVIGPESGVLVPPGDPDTLATALATLMDAPERRAVLGQRARARVVASYSLGSMVDAYDRIYRSLLQLP